MVTSEAKVKIVIDAIVAVPITVVAMPPAEIQINAWAAAIVVIVTVVAIIVIAAVAIVAAPFAITPIAIAQTAIGDCFDIAVGHVRTHR